MEAAGTETNNDNTFVALNMTDAMPFDEKAVSSGANWGDSKLGASHNLSSSATTVAAQPPTLLDTSAIYGPNAQDQGYNRPSKFCLQRIHNDLHAIRKDPMPGIVVMPDETRANTIHALMMGPPDTPYDHGLFLFELCFPDDYPHRPPKVKHTTTGNGLVRMNPNLYSCGKVCLSILGTWEGPGWSSVQSISVRCVLTISLFALSYFLA